MTLVPSGHLPESPKIRTHLTPSARGTVIEAARQRALSGRDGANDALGGAFGPPAVITRRGAEKRAARNVPREPVYLMNPGQAVVPEHPACSTCRTFVPVTLEFGTPYGSSWPVTATFHPCLNHGGTYRYPAAVEGG